ncbi:unnamed protein product, partial [Symbiodinium pilosum]
VTTLEQQLKHATAELRILATPSGDKVQVFVKDVNGRTRVMHFDLDADISTIQSLIAERTECHQSGFYLTGMGRYLQ